MICTSLAVCEFGIFRMLSFFAVVMRLDKRKFGLTGLDVGVEVPGDSGTNINILNFEICV